MGVDDPRTPAARRRTSTSSATAAAPAWPAIWRPTPCKNGRLRALAFNDPSLLTATGNDLAYDQVFCAAAGAARALGRPADRDQQLRQFAEYRPGAGSRSRAGRRHRHAVRHARRQPVARARRPQLLRAASRYGWAESAPSGRCLHYWFDQYQDEHGPGAISWRPRYAADTQLSVLITGGCGYVGTKLTQAVLDRTPTTSPSSTRSGSATICRPIRG